MGFLSGSTLSGGIVNGYNALIPNGGAVETSFYAGGSIKTPLKSLNLGSPSTMPVWVQTKLTGSGC
jgi:hypothetical protein